MQNSKEEVEHLKRMLDEKNELVNNLQREVNEL